MSRRPRRRAHDAAARAGHAGGRTAWFQRLRALKDEWLAAGVPAPMLRELSMGMSGDFEVAIEEGATIVRVGTAIFGSR